MHLNKNKVCYIKFAVVCLLWSVVSGGAVSKPAQT